MTAYRISIPLAMSRDAGRKHPGRLPVDLFLEDQIPLRPIMPAGHHILEVKYDEYLPDYIYQAAQLDNLRQTAYSKYYLCENIIFKL